MMTILIIFFLHTWGSANNPVNWSGISKVEPLISQTGRLETGINAYFKPYDFVIVPEISKEVTNSKELKEDSLTEGKEEKTEENTLDVRPVEEEPEDNSLVIGFLKKVVSYVAKPSENNVIEELIQWVFRQ